MKYKDSLEENKIIFNLNEFIDVKSDDLTYSKAYSLFNDLESKYKNDNDFNNLKKVLIETIKNLRGIILWESIRKKVKKNLRN